MVQRSTTTAFAKSTRPEIGGVVLRESLFRRLDGSAARTVAWISAPPGYGKTTLVASYLEARSYRWAWYQVDPDDDDGQTFLHYLAHATRKLRVGDAPLPVFGPEHGRHLAAFARRWFRALFAGAVGPVALVLDNLHALAADSPLRTLLEAGLFEVPRQCCVIVTSREGPPPALARLQPGGQMVCLEPDELKITSAELAEMAALRGHPLDADTLPRLQQQADGWAAALVLLIEHRKLHPAGAPLAGETTPKAVFDYLAGEIFARFDAPTQTLLLRLACLPRVTAEVAVGLGGADNAARMLFNLSHNDYFVRELVGPEGRVFVVHPLLREFLLRRAAQELPEAVDAAALRRAARLLQAAGQIEDAIALQMESKDWPAAAGLLAEQAAALLAQGRHAALAAWIDLLPPALVAADAPLLQAQGEALNRHSARGARRKFEAAFALCDARGDVPGMARACLGVIEAVLHEFDDLAELDRWLAAHERCSVIGAAADLPPLAVLVARLWRDPTHPSLTRLVHARDLAGGEPHALVRCGAALLRGELPRAASLIRSAERPDGPARPALAVVHALLHWVEGDHAAALTVARAGLARGAADAVHDHDVWLHLMCAAAALGLGEAEPARAALAEAEALDRRRGERAFMHLLQGMLARAGGQADAALREFRSAALVAAEAGLPWLEALAHLALAPALAARGERAAAESQARAAEALAATLGSPPLTLAAHFAHAGVAHAFDDGAGSLAPLRQGLELARALGARDVIGVAPEMLGALCASALARGVAVDAARALIASGRLTPPPAALRLRHWPWAFDIVTLGGFDLRRAGEAIEFSAKGPGRPVELLKVLVALGGQGVRADQLADALWPHVDADYAHKSFTATLHRLRRIFGADDALSLRDGRLGLNPALFRLDTWALDQVLAEVDARLRDSAPRTADAGLAALAEEMLGLYRGPFLPDEAEQPAYIAKREQLRARLLRALTRVARRWEEAGLADAAIDSYLRCIDADELCEGTYRNLMLCYQRHGDVAEAMAIYARLQAVLAARLRSAPSPETQAIYAALRA